ncbi:calmodulin-like protein 4 [Episyrphus balteatus]|uniref:calmodulin-like protein 4 n=1 Tax=Episyrphus balteatus TaxID=286459 RepID=UPI0024850599|nr:calmodulin-like protein 4 [Episyrphus balteatus]
MALHFKEQDIDEFRECFYLFVHSRQITNLDELTLIMRSLGFSPTVKELASYLNIYNGNMSFADFLETIHNHSKVENLPDEVVAAFKSMDTENKGTISTKQLTALMHSWGEGLTTREIDNILREAHVKNNGLINYADFVKIASAPVPDYY